MFHPKNHFGLIWFLLSLSSAEFFVFRTDGTPTDTSSDILVSALWGVPFMYVTFLPALLIVVLIYAACGWLD